MTDTRVPVVRSLEQDLASGQFRAKFSEAVNSKYELSVEASQYTADRMSFTFQAVGSQLALNPKAVIDFVLTVTGKGALPESLADQAIVRPVSIISQVERGNDQPIAGYGNFLTFGPGDAISESISSIQCTCNSASITSTERDKFWRSLMRCWVSDETMASVYQTSGGCPESYDSVAVGSIVGVENHCSYGRTIETSLARRAKQFIERSIPQKITDGGAHGWSREIHVRWPVFAGLFHPWSGRSGIYANSPLARLPNAICNYSQGSIQILMRNMFACLIRQFGRCNVSGVDELATNTHVNDIKVDFKKGVKPTLRLEFVRLNSFRKFPRELIYSQFRTTTVLADPMKAGDGGAFKMADDVCDGEALVAMPPTGRDSQLKNAAYLTARIHGNAKFSPDFVNYDDKLVWDVVFRSIQLPGIPEYVLLTAQKDNRMYSLKDQVAAAATTATWPFAADRGAPWGGAAGAGTAMQNVLLEAYHSRYRAQNAASNLCWTKLEFEIQNGSSTWKFKSKDLAAIRDLDDIYQAVRLNCNADYMRGFSQSDWEKRAMCILLHETQYQHGLSSSMVNYPVTITVRARLQNRCRFTCGSQIAATHESVFPMVHAVPVASEPAFVGVFTNGLLSVGEQSAVLSGYVSSQATYTEALQRAAEASQL